MELWNKRWFISKYNDSFLWHFIERHWTESVFVLNMYRVEIKVAPALKKLAIICLQRDRICIDIRIVVIAAWKWKLRIRGKKTIKQRYYCTFSSSHITHTHRGIGTIERTCVLDRFKGRPCEDPFCPSQTSFPTESLALLEHVSGAENGAEQIENGVSGSGKCRGCWKNHLSGCGAESRLNRPLEVRWHQHCVDLPIS